MTNKWEENKKGKNNRSQLGKWIPAYFIIYIIFMYIYISINSALIGTKKKKLFTSKPSMFIRKIEIYRNI